MECGTVSRLAVQYGEELPQRVRYPHEVPPGNYLL